MDFREKYAHTREYPKDIKPLIKDGDERIFYDENCLLDAGYGKQGTLRDFQLKLNEPLGKDVAMWAHKIQVWAKGDQYIILTENDNGVLGFGGWLRERGDSGGC